MRNLPNAVDLLLMSALDKIAFLPFGYLLDKWRWTIFTGETPFDKMNEKFWEYRIKYQGVSPPVKRNESFFDGGAKYHVALHVPYLRYFVAFILQFQFPRAFMHSSQRRWTNSIHSMNATFTERRPLVTSSSKGCLKHR
ncbi:hypothetical protein MRX96_054449 [Rhipicephalus microplus]